MKMEIVHLELSAKEWEDLAVTAHALNRVFGLEVGRSIARPDVLAKTQTA